MFNAFEELFSPGRKHTQDEQKRLALTREDVGDGDLGRGPIDLASGKVTVRRPAPADEETDGDDDTDVADGTDAADGTGDAPDAPAGAPAS
ncbi:DUF6191 domain-containing protein [Streptomyces cellulosae]|uniref:DUF6191 domain-containing protein n=1 Tax=Streptomyces cellulosae TaxID=1968 RepID=UPI00224F0F25|nr:DUF6191 domain-containing protein [Streptomyces cellulosae]WTC55786.1 DUF6191 domain-containing protein [Streptomyces cellulosae]